MIEGLFFALQLLTMWLLVRVVSRPNTSERSQDLGLFEYKADKGDKSLRGKPPQAATQQGSKDGRRA